MVLPVPVVQIAELGDKISGTTASKSVSWFVHTNIRFELEAARSYDVLRAPSCTSPARIGKGVVGIGTSEERALLSLRIRDSIAMFPMFEKINPEILPINWYLCLFYTVIFRKISKW